MAYGSGDEIFAWSQDYAKASRLVCLAKSEIFDKITELKIGANEKIALIKDLAEITKACDNKGDTEFRLEGLDDL